MAETKTKKVSAIAIIEVQAGETQTLWGVVFTCEGEGDKRRLVAEVSADAAAAMADAGRVIVL